MTPWLPILDTVARLADDLITTDEERTKLALQDRLIDAQMQQGQIDINKIEAAHPSLFVAGWRPGLGWVATIAFGLLYIPKAIVMTTIWTIQCVTLMQAWTHGTPPPVMPIFPDLGVTDVIGLLLALLGMAGIRSFDKAKATDTRQIGEPPKDGP